MTIAALTFRLAATKIVLTGTAATAYLTPVHSNDPSNPNLSFSKSMPDARLEFTVTNPDAIGFLSPDAVYDLVLVPRDAGYTISVNPTQVAQAGTPQADPPSETTPPTEEPGETAGATADPVVPPAPPPAEPPVVPASDSIATDTPPATASAADAAPEAQA